MPPLTQPSRTFVAPRVSSSTIAWTTARPSAYAARSSRLLRPPWQNGGTGPLDLMLWHSPPDATLRSKRPAHPVPRARERRPAIGAGFRDGKSSIVAAFPTSIVIFPSPSASERQSRSAATTDASRHIVSCRPRRRASGPSGRAGTSSGSINLSSASVTGFPTQCLSPARAQRRTVRKTR